MQGSAGRITVDPTMAGLFNADGSVNMPFFETFLVHEARHVADNRHFGLANGPRTTAQVRRTERNAYRTEAAYMKVSGFAQNVRMPNGTEVPLTRETANYGAESSVKAWVTASRASTAAAYADYVSRIRASNRRNGTNQRIPPISEAYPDMPPPYSPPSSY
jgi:hypothetical protein